MAPLNASPSRRHAPLRRPLWFAAVILFATSAALPAQTAPVAPSVSALKKLSLDQLMDIEVTSVSRRPEKLSATASAIQVITGTEIRRTGASSIPEALRLADNLDVAQKNSHDWGIAARGFNTELTNKLLVMIDGRTVYTPLFSGVFWNVQDYLLDDIDRIEVVSGPGGTLWGANAVNGVVNIITKPAEDTRGLYLEAGGGTWFNDFLGARYGGQLAPGVHVRVYGKYFDRSHTVLATGADATDAWHRGQGGFRLDAAAGSADNLTLQGDYYSGRDQVLTGDEARMSGGNVLGRWSHTFSPQSAFTLQLYYDRTHLDTPVPAFTIGNGVVLAPAGRLRDNLDTYDVDFQHRFRAGERHELVWGVGARRTRDDVVNAPAIAFFPAQLQQNLLSGFVQDQITLDGGFSLTLGTKLERYHYTGTETEPCARLQWALAPGRLLWAAASRAVRTPSRIDRDLVQPPRTGFIVLQGGGSNYTSERVVAWELGYRAQPGRDVAASLSAFVNDYDDVRSTSTTPRTLIPLFFANNLEARTYGAEFAGDFQLRDGWRVHAGYALLHESVRVKAGQIDFNNALNETSDPTQRVTFRSSMDLTRDLDLDATLRWTDARPTHNGPNRVETPGYGELDVRFAWRPRNGLELSVVGQNLLHGRHPEYGFPSPTRVELERSFYGKATWRF